VNSTPPSEEFVNAAETARGVSLDWCSSSQQKRRRDDARDRAPTAWPPNADLLPQQRFSWITSLLPFLEEEKVYQALDRGRAWDDANNSQAVATSIRTLLCPSDARGAADVAGPTTDVGIAGVGLEAAWLPAKDPKAGFFGYNRVISKQDIQDGLSNTLMVIEASSSDQAWAAGGSAVVRGLDPVEQPYICAGGPFGVKHRQDTLFRTHSIIANAAFADGTVRSLTKSISPQTLEGLATIAGGEVLGDDF
jgi:hypothetical protein